MREVHLVCNAHLDPIWQWEWEEGAASALSTFKSAADLADEFDYIFCHNEVTLYKYIEEYAPTLFERIRELVKCGKWHITGGWYLQPDCNMPCGESIVRQIKMGQRYFEEKLGVKPETAFNVDAFGHSVGLVQIIKKCGQKNCIIVRTGDNELPARQMVWQGVDGSEIKLAALRGYNSALGNAFKKIDDNLAADSDETYCVLWGVGNHGGGPSRKDLADIAEYCKREDIKIFHSTPDAFFESINPNVRHGKSLRVSMPGCYTSVSEIKQKHAEFEDMLYTTEKICSVAAMRGLITYPEKELDEATEDLLNAQFHDVLPGTCIKVGEENGLRLLEHGMLILNRLRARAYFALSATQPKAKEGEYPFLVFNPHPYEWETEIECEFTLADQNWDESKISKFTCFDENGNEVAVQFIKEESNLNLDWRKRLIFRAKLAPLAVSRFSVYAHFEPAQKKKNASVSGNVVFENAEKYVEIDSGTGLLKSYKVNGREYIKGDGFKLFAFEDNADPWGMAIEQLKAMGGNAQGFELMAEPNGVFEGMKPIQIIEDGEIYLAVEAFFRLNESRARVEYIIYKNTTAIDVKIDLFAGNINRLYRVSLPLNICGEYIGQTLFGTEPLYMNGKECVAQRFVALKEENGNCLALFNKGTYGSMFRDNTLSMSLLRTATYCAHPIDDRPLIPLDRYTKKIDLEERGFSFRLDVVCEESLEKAAGEFCNRPYACNVFPIENDINPLDFEIGISDENIVLAAMKKRYNSDSFILRLFNNSPNEKSAVLRLNGKVIELHFGKYEVKTVEYGNALTELDEMII